MIELDNPTSLAELQPAASAALAAASEKIKTLDRRWSPADGAPVFTVDGQYASRGWTEWTQGFQFGMALLAFDGLGDSELLRLGRDATLNQMAPHVTHFGVHDHGFNNVSTYGNLLRLTAIGKADEETARHRSTYELALQASGAVQAARWSKTHDGGGYIYSFNGPQSLFADTIRSLRALALSYQLGHVMMGEHDEKIDLLGRILDHADSTARYNVYYGEDRDRYDIRGRVVHESIFNPNDHRYRCPSTQQGYSPFTTWTRGHAWVLCGFAEELEWLSDRPEQQFAAVGREKAAVLQRFVEVARATADFYIEQTPTDGIPYWDTGAPGLVHLGDYQSRPAEPFNDYEPVDSSAAAIAAQGLLRLGRYLTSQGDPAGERYTNAGFVTARTLLAEPYLSTDSKHEGLLLHSIYHHPNAWDYVPPGSKIPHGEACMWGDYHLAELALYLLRLEDGQRYYTFFDV